MAHDILPFGGQTDYNATSGSGPEILREKPADSYRRLRKHHAGILLGRCPLYRLPTGRPADHPELEQLVLAPCG